MNRPYAAKLQELLQASYNLPNAVCDLGRIELGPPELEEITKVICGPNRNNIDAKAHYLLAASGFNAEQVLNDISLIKLTKPNASVLKSGQPKDQTAPPQSSDTNAIQRSIKPAIQGIDTAKSIKTAIDPLVTQSAKDFEDFLAKHLQADWEGYKSEILDIVGDENHLSNKESGKKRTGLKILGPQSLTPTVLTLSMKSYAEVIVQFCDNNFKAENLANSLAEAAKKSGENRSFISDSWKILNAKSPIAFLEQQYREYIENEISSRRLEAKLGGVPTNFSKIKAFVALKYRKHNKWDPKLTLINKTPIWAYLYYLLRTGHHNEALQLVLERKDIFESLGSSFAVYFKAWVESGNFTLSSTLTESIRSEYHHLFKQGTHFDPYKQALYKIIGKCDLAKHNLPLVAVTTEDWLWLQLHLVQNGSASSVGTNYTMQDLRSYILEIGPEHLSEDPVQYFAILVLLGLYSEAVNFLKSRDEIHSVHYAIVLAANNLLTHESAKQCQFDELVGRYTSHFRRVLPNLAVDYLTLINLPATSTEQQAQEQQQNCYEAIQELILETRRFSELIGDITSYTEHVVPGSVEKRMSLIGINDKHSYLQKIAHGAAVKADNDGKIIDAILLYRLSEDMPMALKLVNTQLGLLLSNNQIGQPVASSNSQFDVLQIARNMMRVDAEYLSTPAASASLVSKDICVMLLAISDCVELLSKQEWQQCLDRISQTGLLVLNPETAINEVRESAQNFVSYDESISRNIPHVLLMAMTCIVKIIEGLKTSGTFVGTRLLEQYRNRANNCMIYAGLIQFRMAREVYLKLTQLEAQIA